MKSPRVLSSLAPMGAIAAPESPLPGDLAGVEYAVTISQPWATLTVEGPRRYHSLSFRPPTIPLGKRIAIYAAQKPDTETVDQAIALLDSIGVTQAERMRWATRKVRGAIIGVTTFAGLVAEADDPWFVGPFALWMTSPVAIDPVVLEARPGVLWKLTHA